MGNWLTYEEELEIGQRLEEYRVNPDDPDAKAAAERAAEQLLDSYTPALWTMVNSSIGQNESSIAIDREDLFNEAYIEAYKLAFKFNPNGFSKGNPGRRFNSYIQKSVIRKVRAEIMKASTPLSASVTSIKADFHKYAQEREINPETAHAGVRGGFIPGHDDTVDFTEMSERLPDEPDDALRDHIEYPEMIAAIQAVFSDSVASMMLAILGADDGSHGTINDARTLSEHLGIPVVTASQFLAALPEIYNHPAIRSSLLSHL